MGSRKINQLEKKKGGRSPPTVKVKTKQVPQYKTGLTTSMWCTIAGFYGRSNGGTIEVVKEVDNALFFYIFFFGIGLEAFRSQSYFTMVKGRIFQVSQNPSKEPCSLKFEGRWLGLDMHLASIFLPKRWDGRRREQKPILNRGCWQILL